MRYLDFGQPVPPELLYTPKLRGDLDFKQGDQVRLLLKYESAEQGVVFPKDTITFVEAIIGQGKRFWAFLRVAGIPSTLPIYWFEWAEEGTNHELLRTSINSPMIVGCTLRSLADLPEIHDSVILGPLLEGDHYTCLGIAGQVAVRESLICQASDALQVRHVRTGKVLNAPRHFMRRVL